MLGAHEKARRSGLLAGLSPRGYFFFSWATRLLVIWIMRSKPPAIEPSV
jgi:hypothetical protein